MAENFNNYLTSITFTGTSGSGTIVPKENTSLTVSGVVKKASGSRTQNSVCQLHSIYLTLSAVTNISSNPENDGLKLSLSVYDGVAQKDFYIAKCVNVVPNSSFYIEKTVTLKPQDSLKLEFHGKSGTGSPTLQVDTVCSGVEIS